MDQFKNKYRIASARLQSWDYGQAGLYFITICTHNREHFFGKITAGEMQLSDLGRIAEREWLKTFELRADMNLFMGDFVVMPNHFHAIIGIGENGYNMKRELTDVVATERGIMQGLVSGATDDSTDGRLNDSGDGDGDDDGRDAMHCVSTMAVDPTGIPNPAKNRFGPQSKNLASIVRGFKSSVTVAARQINPEFQWQPRFHDHIVRNAGSFHRISQYIINNPGKWDDDQFKK